MIVEGILLWTDVVIAVASMVSAITAFGAFIFAWKGFENLKNQLKELKRQNDLNEEQMKISFRPRCELQWVRSKGEFSEEYEIFNNGMPAYEFELLKRYPGEKESAVGNKDVLYTNERFKFEIRHKDEQDNNEIKGCELTMFYRDWMHNWYKQKAESLKEENAYEIKPITFPPERTDKKSI